MFLLVEVPAKLCTVVGTAQLPGKRHHIYMLRLSFIRLHILLRRRAGGLRSRDALLHPAQKIKLVKCLIILNAVTVHLKF